MLHKIPISFSIACVVLICSSFEACAQPAAPQTPGVRGAQYYELLQQARSLSKDKPAEAAAIYRRLTKSYPDDIEVWLDYARVAANAKSDREVEEALSEALARGSEYEGFVSYNLARAYARSGNKEQALAWLEKSLAMPFEARPQIGDNEAFAAWRNDSRFRQLAGLSTKQKLTREEAWNQDLDFFLAEVRRMDYSYRTGPLPAGLESDVRRLRQRIPQLSDTLMVPEIQRLLARLGDGHSMLRKLARRAPLKFYQFSDGVFVIDAPPDWACIGDRVVAVGTTPIETALQRLKPFLSVDNEMGVRALGPAFLRFPDYLQAADVVPNAGTASYAFEGRSGTKHSYTPKLEDTPDPMPRFFPSKLAGAGPVPRYLKNIADNYWFEPLNDRTIYLQFNQVQNKPSESIEQFAQKLKKPLLAPGVKNLIIDVRLNGGGNLNLFPPLLRAIVAFQETRENAGIYVLTSRLTFSAAEVFINELDHYTSAVVAGEPAGSRPNFVGESAQTMLPNSGWLLTISTRYHQTEDQDHRTWIAPKIPVELSSADYFANRDPVLDAVLEVINRPAK